jgi:hypothetical protein
MQKLTLWLPLALLSLTATAQINPNIPLRLNWVGYAGNPIDKSIPLLRSDSSATIVVEARAGKVPGQYKLAIQPVILNRTLDTLYVRIPASNLLPATGAWVEVKVGGIIRFAGALVVSKDPTISNTPVAVSYVLIPGTAGAPGAPASTSALTALNNAVAGLQAGKLDNTTYSAFLSAQATIDANQNTNTTNALNVAQGAAAGVTALQSAKLDAALSTSPTQTLAAQSGSAKLIIEIVSGILTLYLYAPTASPALTKIFTYN